jgi:hypothetical protein
MSGALRVGPLDYESAESAMPFERGIWFCPPTLCATPSALHFRLTTHQRIVVLSKSPAVLNIPLAILPESIL